MKREMDASSEKGSVSMPELKGVPVREEGGEFSPQLMFPLLINRHHL